MKRFILLLGAFVSIATLSGCKNYGSNKELSRFTPKIDQAWIDYDVNGYLAVTGNTKAAMDSMREKMNMYYGENYEIKGTYNKALAAKTLYGTYVGKTEEDAIVSWKGIPYAKAPINELRWKAPQKLDKSDKVYEAYYFGHTAIQLEGKDEPSGFYPQGEDCLNLNIWNNVNDLTKNKPVMVWIHGGGYIQGGATEPEYDGTNFVTYNPDVIFVSVDYRVDMLGFINLTEVPGGEEYKESANLGLLDEVAALQWLNENIAAFGGDPSRITIFGESAGGGSCSALTIMPAAKGLFKRAIIQSGSAANLLRTKEKSLEHTRQILEITGAKNMDDLLELTPSDIRKLAHIRDTDGPTSYTLPELDGVVLPKDVRDIIDNSDARDGIEILSGTTEDEYEYWSKIMTKEYNAKASKKTLQNFENNLKLQANKDRYHQFRDNLKGDDYSKDIQSLSYLIFHAPCRYEAKAHASRGNKVYQYIFTEKSDEIDGYSYGAYHGFELEFLFANYGTDLSCSLFEAFRLSLIMQRMWINFAKTGNPSINKGDIEGVPSIEWSPYTIENENVMQINTLLCQQGKDPFGANINLMGDLFWARFGNY